MSNADKRTTIALFRYTLILPLLRDQYPPGGKQKLRRQIAAQHHDIPHSSRHTVSATTLARWERIYQEKGFEGLKPKPDKGSLLLDSGQFRRLIKQCVLYV